MHDDVEQYSGRNVPKVYCNVDIDDLRCSLQGYKVYYTRTPDMPIPLWTVHVVEGSRLTTIPNLLTNRTYTLKVLAYTAVGDGPLSEPIQVKMQQGGIVVFVLFCLFVCLYTFTLSY